MKVLRITRHEATKEQHDELQRIFGPNTVITTHSESLPMDPKAAVKTIDKLAISADVIEAVLPMNLLEATLRFSKFSKRGGKIIRAKMLRRETDEGVIFEFRGYEEILEVVVETRDL